MLKKKFSCLVVLLFITFNFCSKLSAEVNVDSLIHITNSNTHDSVKMNSYIHLCEYYQLNQPEKTIEYGRYLARLAKKNKNTNNRALANWYIGSSFMEYDKLDSAEYHLKQAIELSDISNNLSLKATCYQDIAIVKENQYKDEEAINYYNKSIALAREIGDSTTLSLALVNFGGYYLSIENYAQAIEKILEDLNINEKLGDSINMFYDYNALGIIYKNLDYYEKSLAYYIKAIELIDRQKNQDYTSLKAAIFHNMAALHSRKEENQMAISYYFKALRLYESHHKKYEITQTLNNIAQKYLKLKKIDSANIYLSKSLALFNEYDKVHYKIHTHITNGKYYYETKQYKKCILLLDSLLRHNNIQALDFKQGIYVLLSKSYQKTNQYENAYNYLLKFNTISDSINNNNLKKKILQKQFAYDFEKEQEKLELEQEKERLKSQAKLNARKLTIAILIIILLASIVISLLIFKGFRSKKKDNIILARQKEEIEEKEKLTSSLLNELNHRIKNNLQMISSLFAMQAYKHSGSDTTEALNLAQQRIDVIAILHQHLYKKESALVPGLKIYLEELAQYVLLASGNEKKVAFKSHIDEVFLNVNELTHFGLIVNELLTNAFKHGISANSNSNNILLVVKQTTDFINILVKDSGDGFVEEITNRKEDGFGLELVKTLTHQYDGKLKINNNLGAEVNVCLKLTKKT